METPLGQALLAAALYLLLAGALRLLWGEPPRQGLALGAGIAVGVVVAAAATGALGGFSVLLGLMAGLSMQYAVGRYLSGDGRS